MTSSTTASKQSASSSRSSRNSQSPEDRISWNSERRPIFTHLSTDDKGDLRKLLARIGESSLHPAPEAELDVIHKRLIAESKVYGFERHLIIHALEHMKQFPETFQKQKNLIKKF